MLAELHEHDPDLAALPVPAGAVLVSPGLQGRIFCEIGGDLIHRLDTGLLDHPLPVGSHELRLTHPECEPFTQEFTLDKALPVDLQPAMTRKLLYGSLMMGTKPEAGVRIFLDEEEVGRTPLAEPLRVRTRRYLMRLEISEWDRWVRYVTVRPDRTTEVEAELEQTAGEASSPAPPSPPLRHPPPPILRQ